MSRYAIFPPGPILLTIITTFLWLPISCAQEEPPPPRIYKTAHSFSELVRCDAKFAEFAKRRRADIEDDLKQAKSHDPGTLRRMYQVLVWLGVLEGRYDDAIREIERMKTLNPSAPRTLVAGLSEKALIDALKETGEEIDDSATRAAFVRHLAAGIDGLPWESVKDEIKYEKTMSSFYTENTLIGTLKSELDAVVTKTGEMSALAADTVVQLRYMLKCLIPLREELLLVYREAIKKNHVVEADIWSERSVVLGPEQNLAPVRVAIWDSGVDPSVFKGRMFVNRGEEFDGRDNDGNGFVDDVNGIAYDFDARRTPEMLYPLGDAAGRFDSILESMESFFDARSAVEGPKASAYYDAIAKMKPDEVEAFSDDIRLCWVYVHGTHAAGIVAKGNPFVQIMNARTMMSYYLITTPLSIESAQRHAQSYRDTSTYLRKNDVRVTSMSWGWPIKDITHGLADGRACESLAERRELADRIYTLLKEGLQDAIAGSPDILFVASAGGGDEQARSETAVPSCLELPNLVVVGAVDRAGRPISPLFSGKNVLWANGFEVESLIPGGRRLKLNGTSTAAASAANLAAKLIALEPRLGPAEVIELMRKGSDRMEDKIPYWMLNPKRSVESLLERK